jgi:hypothetical protein
MRWITRERPKIDRIACPWLIQRFIDTEAQFLYVPTEEVFRVTKLGQVDFIHFAARLGCRPVVAAPVCIQAAEQAFGCNHVTNTT